MLSLPVQLFDIALFSRHLSKDRVNYEQVSAQLVHNQAIALCLEAGFRPAISQEAASEQAVIGLVAAGVGVALVSACLSGLRADEVIYRPLIEPTVSVEYAVSITLQNCGRSYASMRSLWWGMLSKQEQKSPTDLYEDAPDPFKAMTGSRVAEWRAVCSLLSPRYDRVAR